MVAHVTQLHFIKPSSFKLLLEFLSLYGGSFVLGVEQECLCEEELAMYVSHLSKQLYNLLVLTEVDEGLCKDHSGPGVGGMRPLKKGERGL